MKTRALWFFPKSHRKPWPQGEASILLRLRNFLLRDVLPSLLLVVIVAFFAALVGAKIEQAKDARTDVTNGISSPR